MGADNRTSSSPAVLRNNHPSISPALAKTTTRCEIAKQFQRISPALKGPVNILWWAFRDSNPEPAGYEPDALTDCAKGPRSCEATT